MTAISVLQYADEETSGMMIIEAQNTLKEIRDGIDERLNAIEKRLDEGVCEYSAY